MAIGASSTEHSIANWRDSRLFPRCILLPLLFHSEVWLPIVQFGSWLWFSDVGSQSL